MSKRLPSMPVSFQHPAQRLKGRPSLSISCFWNRAIPRMDSMMKETQLSSTVRERTPRTGGGVTLLQDTPSSERILLHCRTPPVEAPSNISLSPEPDRPAVTPRFHQTLSEGRNLRFLPDRNPLYEAVCPSSTRHSTHRSDVRVRPRKETPWKDPAVAENKEPERLCAVVSQIPGCP
jgi:hypothetical protein